MTEQRRKQIVYSIFALAVIWGIWNFTSRKKVVVDVAPQGVEAQAAVATIPSPTAATAKPLSETSQDWGRDPFAKANRTAVTATAENTPSGFRVAAVSEANGKLLAMVNGQMVGKGDRLGEWQVIELTKTKVVLQCKGQKITLNIGG